MGNLAKNKLVTRVKLIGTQEYMAVPVYLSTFSYNANVNLFGIVTMVAEFLPGGGVLPHWRVDPVRLFHNVRLAKLSKASGLRVY